VVVILNGLGSVKHDELFVVYGEVDRLLRGSGINKSAKICLCLSGERG
jgi:dihydroxyacetone kinase